MRSFLLLSLLCFMGAALFQPAHAQNILQRTLNADTMPNLIPDPGFEEVTRLYCRWTQEARKFNENMVHWNSATETTPDHYSTANDPECWSHPAKRTDGKAGPHGGNAMVGIKTWGKGNTPTYWHEYVQCELPEPLEAGVRYIAEMWILRANFSNEASNNIGISLRDVPVITRDRLPLYVTPHVNEEKVIDKRNWHKVSGVFDAEGNERFVMIGNFYGDGGTQHEQQPEGERGAYYFIDDVNIRIAPPGTPLTPRPKESVPPPPKQIAQDHAGTEEVDLYTVEPEVGKSIRLDNIFFDFDKATLKKESEDELGRIVDLMTDYPYMRIEISAHTDDQGSDAYNLKLSQERAKAVVQHLTAKKIEGERLSWVGHGETKPIADNTTEEGRSRNRRVEFKVMER